ncbi:MAG: repeat-containing protein, partial [Verrucomicrobiaceae bacterium]|nr:repeat-containing protein [Verrucomicrobiaceae bacterium]
LIFAAPPAQGEPRNDRGAVEALAMLATIYLEAGRAADTLQLLDQSPQWGVPDLSALSANLTGETPLTLTAARALAQVNRKDEARRIALRLVQDYPGKDSGYELLLSLGTEGLEKQMDEIYKGDHFEERPLIWKARLQFLAGRLDEAEKTVRAAIAVDPSDGEQGKGDRMRAYAVLGDILEKKGDADQAKTMRGAVAAIRISENADDWWQAGLLSRAVKMYEEALNHFADAYCIQSRLALRYSEMGDSEKAEQYYRRAFELMPDSFGRVESHCFGCEGAFAGERAQGIADKVFTELAFKLPDRPQVFYLLGYLREAQGHAEDAATHYRKAVKLDPEYLNAWNRLQGLDDEANLPFEERERIELSLFRIDPLGHHSHPSLDKLSNLGGVWDAILAAERSRPERPAGPLYPLAASGSELDKLASMQGQRFRSREDFFERREQLRDQFANHPLIRFVSQYLESVNQLR